MKRLFIIAALVCGAAFADTVATLENTAGGLIVITDTPCSNKQGKIAYSTSDTAPTQFGCWFTDDNFVHIRWDNTGNLRSYSFDSWKLAPKKQKGNTL